MGEKNLEELENSVKDFETIPKSEKVNKETRDLVLAAKEQIEKLKKCDRMLNNVLHFFDYFEFLTR